jgi:hypothetical protein
MTLRRNFLILVLSLVLSPSLTQAAESKFNIEVWKSPTCGCCKAWIEHLTVNSFTVIAHDVGNNAARAKLGMPRKFGSCHTGLIDGYVIEGHVPASDIKRLLTERPDALGLSVPGMPIGSPGMDGPMYKGQRDPYEVLLVNREKQSSVFNRYHYDK